MILLSLAQMSDVNNHVNMIHISVDKWTKPPTMRFWSVLCSIVDWEGSACHFSEAVTKTSVCFWLTSHTHTHFYCLFEELEFTCLFWRTLLFILFHLSHSLFISIQLVWSAVFLYSTAWVSPHSCWFLCHLYWSGAGADGPPVFLSYWLLWPVCLFFSISFLCLPSRDRYWAYWPIDCRLYRSPRSESRPMKNGPAVSSRPLSSILLVPRFFFLIRHSPHFISLCFQNSSLHQFNPSSLFLSFLSLWLLSRDGWRGEATRRQHTQAVRAHTLSWHHTVKMKQ